MLYTGKHGRVAHECIIDTRPLNERAGVTVDDIAKRLIDYGFHPPTMSWPVPGTLMIEPTESETKAGARPLLRGHAGRSATEASAIEDGRMDRSNNPLKNAPHTVEDLVGEWDTALLARSCLLPCRRFSRRQMLAAGRSRVDNVYGDRNLVCSCPPMEVYVKAAE